jgi:hypothetical protein
MGLPWILLPASTAAIVGARLAGAGAADEGVTLEAVAAPLGLLALPGRVTVEGDEQHLEWCCGGSGRPREGMLCHATGPDAVRRQSRDSRRLHLGSADPKRLTAFLTARLAR